MCYSRRYIEELQNQCKCLPWALGASIPQKVLNPVVCVNQCEIFQNTSFCDRNAISCIERVSKRHSDCKISCSGLYAVVWYLSDEQTDKEFKKGKSGQKFARMTSAYHRYLNNYAENLVFNSSSEDLSAGQKRFAPFFTLSLCFSFSKRFPPVARGGDLLCAGQLRRDRERQKVDSGGSAWPHWRHHGPPHRVLHPQVGWLTEWFDWLKWLIV